MILKGRTHGCAKLGVRSIKVEIMRNFAFFSNITIYLYSTLTFFYISNLYFDSLNFGYITMEDKEKVEHLSWEII